MAEGVLAAIAERKRRDISERLKAAAYNPPPTQRSLRAALERPGARFIMEVKKASPSGHRSSVSVQVAVDAYAPVADAISVLTDTPFFGGSLDDLRAVRARFDGPILAKDFIVDPRQGTEARTHGADAVLAILGMIDDEEARAIIAESQRLRMDVIVEVHDERELRRALTLGEAIIGINNRDLKTLRTDLAITERLARAVPKDRIVISESGIGSRKDVERLAPLVDAFLVGSSLMAADNVSQAVRALVYGNVKICGVTRHEDVDVAAEAGATHVGMIFVEESPRKVGGEAARNAARVHQLGLRLVGVFRDHEHEFVARTVCDIGLHAVQLHGRQQDLRHLRSLLHRGCEIWTACGVGETAEPARLDADRSLFDSLANGQTGGTGRTFDWRLIAGRLDLRRAFLAGGIGPTNARAAQRVGAYGIDVGSGVEAAPGRKDHARMQALFRSLRLPCRRSVQCV